MLKRMESMRVWHYRCRVTQSGFTLIELAVVLAVVAIMATVVVPDFIEVNRNDLSQQAASEVMVLLDNAKWYFTNSSRWTPYNASAGDDGNPDYDPTMSHWPGDTDRDLYEDSANAAEDCLRGNGIEDDGNGGHRCHVARVSNSDLENPWNERYVLEIVRVPGNPLASGFAVMTNVPTGSAAVFRSLVPGGWCANEGTFDGTLSCPNLGAPVGFVTCCALVPEPGNEASYQAMKEEQTPAGNSGACVAVSRDSNNRAYCPEGWTLAGIECSGKQCGNLRPRCCPPGT